MRASHLFVTTLATVVLTAGCQHKTEVPALSGPSSLSTTLNVTASPDRILQDGSAHSNIEIEAIGFDGKPRSGIPIRVDLFVNGVLQDFGALSNKSPTTGSNGIASIVYTAPPPSTDQTTKTVTISAVAVGNDAQATHTFSADIQLMPIGVILPPVTPADTPVADFTISPTPVLLNVASTFDASSSCAVAKVNNVCPQGITGAISSYNWNFGDGSTATEKVVSHTYTTTGTFSVTLTVTNDRGLSTTKVVPTTPQSNDPFTGDWFFSPLSPAVNSPVIFNADPVQTSPGHQVVTYNWTFGDGGTGTGFMTTHTFTVAASYNVVLSVVDDLGRKKVFSPKAVAIGTGNPVPTITTSPTSPTAGKAVLFDASSTTTSNGATITDYQWNFGDGFSSTVGPNVSHIYVTAGTYTVRLTVTDSQGRTGSVTVSVTIG